MRAVAALLAILVWVVPSLADMNPDCQVCIDFSGTATSWSNVQSRVDPDPYTTVDAYVCIYGINGFAGICFTGYVTPGVSAATSFTSLLPGNLSIGPWDEGITMASTECHTDRFMYVAKLELFCLGPPGDVMILDHPEYPRWVMDCTQPFSELDYYCVWMHGGVGKPALEGDEDCYPVVPVEEATWGSLKALFR